MTDSDPPLSFEREKWLHDISREDAKNVHEANSKFLESLNEVAVKSADTTLRTAILVNGGAAAAVLAFIGSLATKDKITSGQVAEIANSLMFFAWGVAASAAAMAVSYLVHYATLCHAASHKKQWSHPYVVPGKSTVLWSFAKNLLHLIAIILGVATLIFFVRGMIEVRVSIGSLHW